MGQHKYAGTVFVIILLTSCLFSGLFYHEYNDLKKYMGYITENGRAALFHEEYTNQNIALNLTRAFSVDNTQNSADLSTICRHAEKINNTYGLNLTQANWPQLPGTLQSRNADCESWAVDVPHLAFFHKDIGKAPPEYSFSHYTRDAFNNIRYYIDLKHNYIYINQIIDSRKYRFNNWLMSDNGRINIDRSAHSINIDPQALNDLHAGNSIISHIYRDGYSRQNIISMLTPVFARQTIKGVIVTDINIDELTSSFYTADRPLLWKFLTLYVTDNESGDTITFHQPRFSAVGVIHHQEKITHYYTLNITLDIQYLLLSNLWLIALYLISTVLLCRYARYHLIRHASLSQENISDAMTGLYNRKILSSELNATVQHLQHRNIAVTVVAVDCDKLKTINDTLGHHMGDKAISRLGQAISQSIRKSDYGIRLGGDEFSIILIDSTLNKGQQAIERIFARLQEIDPDRIVTFSWGCYQLTHGDTLETAMLKADALLYEHKRNKYQHEPR